MTTKLDNLAACHPDLSNSWHATKNEALTPFDVTPGSHKQVWWQCERGHEWKAVIYNRAKGSGCPYCAGQKVSADNNLAVKVPNLTKEWHPTKNGELTPFKVRPGSHKKAWWQCERGHEWNAVIASRASGTGCPYCSGKLAAADNNLALERPGLIKEWHPTKNGELTPYEVTPGSGKKVWWQCERGHEWKAVIYNRAKGSGCPYCAGQKVSADNNLAVKVPNLTKEWHPTKNGELTPYDVTPGSHKQVWWQCERGHEWNAVIASRASGTGCPYCAGQKVSADNNLAVTNPDLTKEWHSTKNDELTPFKVTPGSRKMVWWRCERGHEWEAVIRSRTSGSGCPMCRSASSHGEN